MNPSVGDLCTRPRNPLVRDSKRRPVVVLSPAYGGRSTVIVVPLTAELSSRRLPLRLVIEATPANALPPCRTTSAGSSAWPISARPLISWRHFSSPQHSTSGSYWA